MTPEEERKLRRRAFAVRIYAMMETKVLLIMTAALAVAVVVVLVSR